MTLLRARNLSKSFGGVHAVRAVDFDLEPGEIRALIGPNGAGKTTFVGMLCGRVTANAGTVEFRGRDITALPMHRRVRRGIAYTFQITSIFPNLTARENIAVAAQNRRAARAAGLRDAVAATLRQVGLEALQHQRAGDLAYGHQRLLEAAMGLALAPRLLILDEPTQGLSDGEIERFCGLIAHANRAPDGATILLIEHNLSVVMALARRITVLERGQVLAEGAPDEIRRNAAVQAAYLGA
ncbi:MAG: ABC transporter ATP-binding protein [bacterium]